MAVRRELLEQAQQAADAGDHARAVDLAERALRISPSTSLRGLLAHEQSAAGMLADALGNAEICAHDADQDTSMRNRREILRECQSIVSELRARVGHVTVQVPRPSPVGLHVRVAGHELSDAVLGVPYIVTPGAVVIEASAEGRPAFRAEVQVASGATVDVTVWGENPTAAGNTATPARNPSTAASTGTTATSTGTTATSTGTTATSTGTTAASTGTTAAVTPLPAARTVSTPVRNPPEQASGPGILPFVVMGVGVVSLGAAGAMALLENDALSQLQQPGNCMSTSAGLACPDSAENRQRASNADTYMIVGDVALGVGVAAIAAGAAWWLLARGAHETPPRASLQIAPTHGGMFVGIGGAL